MPEHTFNPAVCQMFILHCHQQICVEKHVLPAAGQITGVVCCVDWKVFPKLSVSLPQMIVKLCTFLTII